MAALLGRKIFQLVQKESRAHRFCQYLKFVTCSARTGYARHLLLDASSDSRYFGHTPAEYAEAFLKQDEKEMSSQVSVCAFEEDSTLTETGYVGKCLEPFHPTNVLLVTSDWHTKRAQSIFRHKLPQYHWSLAAAKDPRRFGTRWWLHREWAKITFNEWL